MKIQKILSQHRRDFTAIYECDHCGATEEGRGYDDAYFHNEVVPKWKCKECGEVAKPDTPKRQPFYPEGLQL
jgi:ribosomal protein L37AE/L43A